MAIPDDVKVQFVAGAFVALLIGWLDTGAKLSPRQMDAIFLRLAGSGIHR